MYSSRCLADCSIRVTYVLFSIEYFKVASAICFHKVVIFVKNDMLNKSTLGAKRCETNKKQPHKQVAICDQKP